MKKFFYFAREFAKIKVNFKYNNSVIISNNGNNQELLGAFVHSNSYMSKDFLHLQSPIPSIRLPNAGFDAFCTIDPHIPSQNIHISANSSKLNFSISNNLQPKLPKILNYIAIIIKAAVNWHISSNSGRRIGKICTLFGILGLNKVFKLYSRAEIIQQKNLIRGSKSESIFSA